jgi:hypothetical protein
MTSYDKWLVSDLKDLLLQYGVDLNIKGSGVNGRVLKKDYIKMVKKTLKNDINENVKSLEVPQDVWYNIMLNLKYKDLKQTCLTNKSAIKTCEDVNFWINKFNHDKLKIIGKHPQTLKDWIKKYKIASNVNRITTIITNMLNQDNTYTIDTYFDVEYDMNKIIPEYENEIRKARRRFGGDFLSSQGLEIKIENQEIIFKFYYQDYNGGELSNFEKVITWEHLYDILYRYLHYFTSDNLMDSDNLSYSYGDLLKNKNTIYKTAINKKLTYYK